MGPGEPWAGRPPAITAVGLVGQRTSSLMPRRTADARPIFDPQSPRLPGVGARGHSCTGPEGGDPRSGGFLSGVDLG